MRGIYTWELAFKQLWNLPSHNANSTLQLIANIYWFTTIFTNQSACPYVAMSAICSSILKELSFIMNLFSHNPCSPQATRQVASCKPLLTPHSITEELVRFSSPPFLWGTDRLGWEVILPGTQSVSEWAGIGTSVSPGQDQQPIHSCITEILEISHRFPLHSHVQ